MGKVIVGILLILTLGACSGPFNPKLLGTSIAVYDGGQAAWAGWHAAQP